MHYILRLYVAGTSRLSQGAIETIQNICTNHLGGRYELEVIDVLEQPDMAEKDKILATPTLVRELPPPLRKIIGNLSEEEKVLIGLDLVEADRLRRNMGA
ncbi:MAG: circadian clock protein KaiB [Rhizobiales bacterium]|nr:circadian clock protein KaiB [Hyphomicrobiales bacterium]